MAHLTRTCFCGEISENHVGKDVVLVGWVLRRRDHGGIIFIDLRDKSGIVQLVFDTELANSTAEKAHKLRSEFVIEISGKVDRRSEETINRSFPTGEFEIKVSELKILNGAKGLPFQIDSDEKVSEELRLKYRYLDLRREQMQKIFSVRHEVSMLARNFLSERGFCEIETPVLAKSTPEGARDFLVPSRLMREKFYALPQSPQVYKQLLMASGFDRYFQIARCFRDEDLRADRQLEFTQLDLEMSFVDENEVKALCEDLFSCIWKKILGRELELPLKIYDYDEVFEAYGTDRPDTRFDLKIFDLTDVFESIPLTFLQKVIEEKGRIGAICLRGVDLSRAELENWVSKTIKELGASGMLYVRFNEDGTPNSPVAKFLKPNFLDQVSSIVPNISKEDTLFIVADHYEDAWTVLGKLRIECARELDLIDDSKDEIFWVGGFPLFEWSEEDKRWYSKHHPFTAPKNADEVRPESMKSIKARAYDIIWNGCEMGGGSIRIHDRALQEKIFETLGIPPETAREQFGCLLEAQELGCPPHGGIAIGLDRLIANLVGVSSIRDTIAFPKTQSGCCPMMDSPANVDQKQLRELGIKFPIKVGKNII